MVLLLDSIRNFFFRCLRLGPYSPAWKELKDKERQFQLLIDGVRDYGIFMLDAEGRVKSWSTAAQNIFGYAAEDVPNIAWSSFYESEDVTSGKPERDLRIAASHGRHEDSGWHVRKNGTRFWGTMVICPVRQEKEKLQGYSVVARDMTEQRQSAEALRQKEDELNQARKLEAIGRLAGGVAHDFNNLMTGIMGLTEDVCASFSADDPRRRDLEEILKAAQRATVLTRQLLAFGRRQIADLQVLDLNATLSNLEKMVRRFLNEDIEFVMRLSPTLPTIKMDSGQLDQIILNLVLNARDAISSGGKITLETSLMEVSAEQASVWDLSPGPYVSLTIMDTGMGIDAAVMPQIFEPFFTTKDVGRGSGLGLATVYGIVKQNQGHILVESTAGKGSIFRVLLVPSVEKSAPSIATLLKKDPVVVGSGSKELIFVVEDEGIVRRTICRALRKNGYTVYEAAGAKEAMMHWENLPALPQLLLTDLVMPDMNGRELAQWARKRHPELTVLYMSGYSEDIIAQRGILDADMNFIEKSFTPERLLHKVRGILDARAPAAHLGRRSS